MERNDQHLADAFLVVCGAGIGLTFGPLAIQAQFSQPDNRVAIVIGLNLFVSLFVFLFSRLLCSLFRILFRFFLLLMPKSE